MPWPAERTGGAYDAAGLLPDAVGVLHRRLPADGREAVPHRSAVVQRLREQDFTGATGRIDFRAERTGNGRALAILRLPDVYDLDAVPVCVFLIGEPVGPGRPRDRTTGCPAPP